MEHISYLLRIITNFHVVLKFMACERGFQSVTWYYSLKRKFFGRSWFSTPSFFDKSQIFLKIFRNLLCQSFHLKSRTQAWTFNCTLINLSQESCFSDDFILDTASASTENSQIAFKYYVAVEEIIIFTLFDDNFRLLCNLCLLSAGKRK